MTTLDHAHGVVSTKCKHPDCVAAFARYAKRWRLDRARGRKRNVAARPVYLHIASLRGAGWSIRGIAGAAGVSPAVVSRLATGEQRSCRRTIAAAITALDPMATLPTRNTLQTGEPNVPKLGTVRRIQALQVLGWSHDDQAAHSGVATRNLVNQAGSWVRRSTHDRVAAMYRELCTKPGPSDRTRAQAARLGYAGPMEWDDIDHDPAPEPEPQDEP